MVHEANVLGQPVGARVPGWKPPPAPPREPLVGRLCRLEPLDPSRHAESLLAANALDTDGHTWTWLPYGPFESPQAYRDWLEQQARSRDPLFFAIVPLAGGAAEGVASWLRIDPANGSIEVGHIHYSPRLQRGAAATEAMYLMLRRAFELGYRRYEWKCNALNAPSRRAALRYGFVFEGILRGHMIAKGRNRDTAYYSMLDDEWPARKAAFERWLAPENFDGAGKQKMSLSELNAGR